MPQVKKTYLQENAAQGDLAGPIGKTSRVMNLVAEGTFGGASVPILSRPDDSFTFKPLHDRETGTVFVIDAEYNDTIIEDLPRHGEIQAGAISGGDVTTDITIAIIEVEQ